MKVPHGSPLFSADLRLAFEMTCFALTGRVTPRNSRLYFPSPCWPLGTLFSSQPVEWMTVEMSGLSGCPVTSIHSMWPPVDFSR